MRPRGGLAVRDPRTKFGAAKGTNLPCHFPSNFRRPAKHVDTGEAQHSKCTRQAVLPVVIACSSIKPAVLGDPIDLDHKTERGK